MGRSLKDLKADIKMTEEDTPGILGIDMQGIEVVFLSKDGETYPLGDFMYDSEIGSWVIAEDEDFEDE